MRHMGFTNVRKFSLILVFKRVFHRTFQGKTSSSFSGAKCVFRVVLPRRGAFLKDFYGIGSKNVFSGLEITFGDPKTCFLDSSA